MSRRAVLPPRARRLILAAAIAALWMPVASSLAEPAAQAQPDPLPLPDPRQMHFEPVQFNPPEPERLVLDNGLVVYLLEDHELPLVTVTATIRTGSWLDPPDKLGLAALTGSTMRTGGTARMSAAEVDEELERLAAQVSVGIGQMSGSAILDVLTKDLDRGLRIFADILRAPAFDPARVELAKLQTIEAVRRRQDRPRAMAARGFAKLLYGPTHPFAREHTVESISRIARDDLLAFHARTIHPNGIILGVTGDFERGPMLAMLRERFGDWPRGEVQPIVLPPIRTEDPNPEQKIVRVIGKGTSQTHLRVGHLSIKEDDPDYPALAILNDILGGSSFRSRLFRDVRTRQGLAYSVSSTLRTGVRERGVWFMRAETKLDSTEEVIRHFVANIERLREQPVTDKELQEAKDSFVNSYVFSFTSPSSIVSRLIGLEYDGLPPDYLQQLREKVLRLTKENLLQAARRHLHPERLRIVAVGPPGTLVRLLAPFGEVKQITLEPEG